MIDSGNEDVGSLVAPFVVEEYVAELQQQAKEKRV